MLQSPRFVVIDDERDHVEAILEALARLGTAALGIHYDPSRLQLPRCPHLRVLFLDLHLIPGAGAESTTQHIKAAIGVMDQLLGPANGPYGVVVWSRFPADSEEFEERARERLQKVPLFVVALDKAAHLSQEEDGSWRVKDPDSLRDTVMNRIGQDAGLAALLSWEDHVQRAAGDSVAAVAGDSKDPKAISLSTTLLLLAAGAAGPARARTQPFRSANRALAALLTDRVLHRAADREVRSIWQKAVDAADAESTLSTDIAEPLNRALHLEIDTALGTVKPTDRGALVSLPDSWINGEFETRWGWPAEQVLTDDFVLSAQARSQAGELSWLLAQVQAPCDEVQQNSGLLPFILGISLESPSENWLKKKVKKERALWCSPKFMGPLGKTWVLVFHLRFVKGLTPSDVEQFKVEGRLRQQIMAELSHELHSYGSRPGIIRF